MMTWYFAVHLAQGKCESSLATIGECFDKPVIGALVGYVAWAALDIAVSHVRSVAVVPRDEGALLVAYGAF